MIACFVKDSFLVRMSQPEESSVSLATGIGGNRTSKRGAVGLRFNIDDTSFAFTNCHLKKDNDKPFDRIRDLIKSS